MLIEDRISKRFIELEQEMNKLPKKPSQDGRSDLYEITPVQKWATSTMNLISATFGESSPHFKNFEPAYANCRGANCWDHNVDVLKGVFKAAKEDFDGGYLFSVQTSVSGEIFGDFVSLAKAALQESFKDVAAVLACAALEDALKRYANLSGLDVNDKVMQEVVAAIKAKGLVTGAQKGLLDSMPKIRDYAMHANWDKITNQDVGSVIGFVEQFLLTHFS